MDYFRQEELRQYAYEDAKDGSYDHMPSDYEEQKFYESIYMEAEDDLKRDDGELDSLLAYGIIIAVVGIAFIIFLIFAQGALVGYSINYTPLIIIGFVLTGAIMYVSGGSNKFLNFLFYLGCFALATRFFATIVGYYEGVPYLNYIYAETTHLGGLIKYSIFYFIYIVLVPYGLMKLVTMMVREFKTPKQQEKKLNI
ncbi:hypothetical protein [Priestia megaterium]|uniref:Uncharacterized protein n=1 Tax=Priestia megaterium TaxID=1404 RepID=A0A6M6DZP7_PRIMG|nr:hypothetical protein [Priestia megaterium]QJX80373.1 hypothetical protein FDZ14_30260 [Priestia megaterium]